MKNVGLVLFVLSMLSVTKDLYGSDLSGFPAYFGCKLSKSDQEVAKTISVSLDLSEYAGMTLRTSRGSFDQYKLSGRDSYRKILEFQSDYGHDSIELDQAILTTGKSGLFLRECEQPNYTERTQACWTSVYECQRIAN